MIIVSILAMGAISVSALAGLWILNKEYLPLLRELDRSKLTLEKKGEQTQFEKGRI